MDSSQSPFKKLKPVLFIFSEVILFIAWSCTPGSQQLINLGTAKDEIIKYHSSGRYDSDTREAVNEAIKKFQQIVLEQNAAVVFDVDETAISSYDFYEEWDFGYVPKYFDMWVDSSKAPAIPAVLDLYNYLLKKNIKIIFLTGRRENQYESTFRNLINAGYTRFDTLIVKGDEYSDQSAEKFKTEKRSDLVKKGYTIAGTVGDQWSDLSGNHHGIQVKIPNYIYIIY